MSLDQLQSAAHKAGIENQNAWTDLQRAEQAVTMLRWKQQQSALAALKAQMELEAAVRKS